MNQFNSIVYQLTNGLGKIDTVDVTEDKALVWSRQWCIDALSGQRLGQSFCNYFGISNASPLYFFKDNNLSLRWICDNYLKNETKICKLLYENC